MFSFKYQTTNKLKTIDKPTGLSQNHGFGEQGKRLPFPPAYQNIDMQRKRIFNHGLGATKVSVFIQTLLLGTLSNKDGLGSALIPALIKRYVIPLP